MNRFIYLVGKSDPHSQSVQAIRHLGYSVGIFHDSTLTLENPETYDAVIPINFAELDEEIPRLAAEELAIDGLVRIYENYILPAARLAKHLHVPGLPIASAEACTDKSVMRSLFEKAPEKISPAFAAAANEEDVHAFAATHSFPIILKPANLAKSLLVTKNQNLDELLDNYHKSLALLPETYKKYAPNRTPKLIIEEFLEGTIHSVDAFVDSDGIPQVLDQIVDYKTGYDIGYDDNFHYSRILPSKLSPHNQAALRHCAATGIKALGMKNSPAHVEIIMTRDGARIVEIGARNGGYRERMHSLANGIDITGAMLQLVLGKTPHIIAEKEEPCAVLELFPRNPGMFAGIENSDALKNLDSLEYFSLKVEQGQYVGKAAEGYKMCAIIILHHTNPLVFERDLQTVNSSVHVLTV